MSQSSIVKPQYLNTVSPDWCPYISLQELFERNLIKDQSIFPLVIILLILISFSLDYELISSDFVTNSYGESWDSFCEK